MRVLITGCSGAIGRRVAAALSEGREFDLVAGIDVVHPASGAAPSDFTLADVRKPLDNLLRQKQIDTVIHCAFILRPLRDTRLMEDMNVGGALNLIRSCEGSPNVRRIIQISSATVYGFHPGSTPFVEENPLRPNPNFLYAMHKKRVEALFEEFAARRPDVLVTVLRPSLVAGRGESDPVMSYLRNPVVFLPQGNVRLQITHVDDLTAIIRRLLLEPRAGTFNVGSADAVAIEDVVRAFGSHPVFLPYGLLRPLHEAAWRCHLAKLAPAPSAALAILRYSWVVDSGKLLRETGFRFTRSSIETLQELAASARELASP
jgi:UDP-glucose 4-epimerase